jgi:HEPN domain
VVEAAQRDFTGGRLLDLRTLVAADVLDDFMAQANALLDAGYSVAAVSVAGAVLEDALRALCRKHKLPIPPATKLSRLNEDLAKAGAYDLGKQKRIVGIADLRNNADHGQFDKVSKADAEDMVKWVSRFTADHLV